MAERIWKQGSWEWSDLTPEAVRKWGYDEDLRLMEQDEDLLLYDVAFIPVLLELAGDENCAKQGYAYSVLCQFCRELVTRGGAEGTAELQSALSAIPEPAGVLPAKWHGYVKRLLAYATPTGPIDKERAQQIAEELLLGIAGRIGDLSEGSPPCPGWWRFTLRTSVTEHLDVCEATGAFSYHRSYERD